jgi:hypothetical protein
MEDRVAPVQGGAPNEKAPSFGSFFERKVLNELLIIAKGERSLRSLRMTSQKKGRWVLSELHRPYFYTHILRE